MPAPPARASSANSRRTSVGSTSSARPIPAATPATTPLARSRAGMVPTSTTALRCLHDDVAQSDVCVDAKRPVGPPGADALREIRIDAGLAAAEDGHLPGRRRSVDVEADVFGDDHPELADSDIRIDLRVAGRESRIAEVELEISDR